MHFRAELGASIWSSRRPPGELPELPGSCSSGRSRELPGRRSPGDLGRSGAPHPSHPSYSYLHRHPRLYSCQIAYLLGYPAYPLEPQNASKRHQRPCPARWGCARKIDRADAFTRSTLPYLIDNKPLHPHRRQGQLRGGSLRYGRPCTTTAPRGTQNFPNSAAVAAVPQHARVAASLLPLSAHA